LSTFIGTNKSSGCKTGDDWATSITVDPDGAVYLAGRTMSASAPTSDNPFTQSRYYEWNGISASVSSPSSEDSRAFLLKLAPNFTSLLFSGSIISSNYYVVNGTEVNCLSNHHGGPAKVALDNNQNAYLIAGNVGNLFPASDSLQQYGDTVLIVNSSGQRIGATKLTANSSSYTSGLANSDKQAHYTVNPATGAIYFSAKEATGIQTSAGLPKPATGRAAPMLMKLVSPLARVNLASSFNPSRAGETLGLTASTTALPLGGTFVLKREGVEVARSQVAGATTTFTTPVLQAGFYAFTAAYEFPDLSGTITSKTIAQTVIQTAVCP
jgi:hypothetical protein